MPLNIAALPMPGVTERTRSPDAGLDTVKGNAVFHYLVLKYFIMSEIALSASAQDQADQAKEIIEGLLLTNEPNTLRNHLRMMIDSYLLSEDEAKYRDQVYNTYRNLDHALLLTANYSRS